MNEMPIRRDSHENNCFNDLSEERNGCEIIESNSTPILRTECPEDVDQKPEEEVVETSPFNRHYSRSLSRSRHSEVPQVFSGPSRPSLISHHMITFAAEDYDKVDALPDHMTFTILDALAILFSIGSFLFDIGTDIAVAALHYINQDFWYFGLTMAFVLFPTFVMTGISMRWYVLDSREEGSPPISKCQWIMRFIFLLLQLGPILRYFDSLMYGLKFRQHSNSREAQKKYFQYMVYEDTDATMLRLFECFMEAAPQLVLQIYILAQGRSFRTALTDEWTIVAQVVAVLASLVSLSWSLVSYHRALRLSLPDKANMTYAGIAVQFIWRFFSIASRVLALALFASEFRFYISIICVIHWLIMFFWIVSMKTNFCDNRIEELGYNAVLAVMFIFCYFNPVDSPTRRRYLLYYLFMFCENIVIMTLWFIFCAESKWYRVIAMYGYFALFFSGLMFMAIYYSCFHPSGNIICFYSEEDKNQRRQTQLKHKLQLANGLWTTQGRLLHPRPPIPTSFSDSKINKTTKNCIKGKPVDVYKGSIV